MSSEASHMPMGGQVQLPEPASEGTTNGFTAVNGRTSPTAPVSKAVHIESIPDETDPQPPNNIFKKPVMESVPHQRTVSANLVSTPESEATLKRKRSEMDDTDSPHPSGHSGGSEGSVSPEAQDANNEAYERHGADHADQPWNGQPGTEQDEHFRMLAPIQHENQQHGDDAYSTNPPVQNGHMRPGYEKDESTGLIKTSAGVLMDPKKRKRAFTNRTKTGCQTCRRRKKKCDEAKPECNNCTRGGFRCEGYAARVSWPPDNKAKSLKQPMPPTQMPPTPRELQDLSGNLQPRPIPRDPYAEMPAAGQQHVRHRPLNLDEDQSRTMNGWHQGPYPPPQRGYPHEQPHGPQTHSFRDSYDRPISSTGGGNMQYMPPAHPYPPQPSPGIIGTAQQALRGMSQPSPYPGPKTEAQKMRDGELYIHGVAELERAREVCTRALQNFNYGFHEDRKTGQIVKHMSNAARFLYLNENVLNHAPPEANGMNRQQPMSQRKSSGDNCIVEVPFTCEYGTNITLGNYVTIEAGCHISDPREVSIDSDTTIGPGVKILGKVLPLDPGKRASSTESKAKGFRIHIGKQVYIGANCVIQPPEDFIDRDFRDDMLRIGDGSYIKPGSIITESVPPGVVYGSRQDCGVLSGIPHSAPPTGAMKGRVR